MKFNMAAAAILKFCGMIQNFKSKFCMQIKTAILHIPDVEIRQMKIQSTKYHLSNSATKINTATYDRAK